MYKVVKDYESAKRKNDLKVAMRIAAVLKKEVGNARGAETALGRARSEAQRAGRRGDVEKLSQDIAVMQRAIQIGSK